MTSTASPFAPLAPVLERLAQSLAAALDNQATCDHDDVYDVRHNVGDGTPCYDVIVTMCADCDLELGQDVI